MMTKVMTESLVPTDAEIKELIAKEMIEYSDGAYADHGSARSQLEHFASAVLAKWGAQPAPSVAAHPACKPDMLVNAGALKLALNVLRRAGKHEVADELEKTAHPAPQPTQAQAGAVPLDEARRLFDAGWKAAALFCDREDVVADGIIGFGACPQFEAAFSAANGIKGGQHGSE